MRFSGGVRSHCGWLPRRLIMFALAASNACGMPILFQTVTVGGTERIAHPLANMATHISTAYGRDGLTMVNFLLFMAQVQGMPFVEVSPNARDQRALKFPPHALPSESMSHKNSIRDACATVALGCELDDIRKVCQKLEVGPRLREDAMLA